MNENLNNRLFKFAVKILRFLPKLPKTHEMSVVRYQLAKNSSSSGANYEEAQAGSSKPDFNNKVRISLREMRESNYWLRIIKSSFKLVPSQFSKLEFLIKESNELKNILGSIIVKSKKKNLNNKV